LLFEIPSYVFYSQNVSALIDHHQVRVEKHNRIMYNFNANINRKEKRKQVRIRRNNICVLSMGIKLEWFKVKTTYRGGGIFQREGYIRSS
jgi:hypothetical protein